MQGALEEYQLANRQMSRTARSVCSGWRTLASLCAPPTRNHQFVEHHKDNAQREGIRPPPDIHHEHFSTSPTKLKNALGADWKPAAVVRPAEESGQPATDAPAPKTSAVKTSQEAADTPATKVHTPPTKASEPVEPYKLLKDAGLPIAPARDDTDLGEAALSFVREHKGAYDDYSSGD